MEQTDGKVQVVVFDLNGTFYNKSSKDEFFKFVCSKKPQNARFYFQMLYYKLLVKLHQVRQTEFKENFFNYLDNIPPEQVETYAREFWQKEYPENFNDEIKSRLDTLKKEGAEICCATGGLELYVKPLFQLYPVDYLAGTRVTYVDNTYKVEGEACKDEEKLKRLEQHYDGRSITIIEAYSDSKEAILDKAKKAYLVKDGKITPYEQ
ncbi:HAD family hydrolase [Pontibacter chitinilyticus]|uniref:HAD family hydrolase n=1 Tax=Pontibacter chitinilyticus TaxID=2674989 RepID=UPI00321AFBDE